MFDEKELALIKYLVGDALAEKHFTLGVDASVTAKTILIKIKALQK